MSGYIAMEVTKKKEEEVKCRVFRPSTNLAYPTSLTDEKVAGMGAHSTLNCLLAHKCSSPSELFVPIPDMLPSSFDSSDARVGSVTGGAERCSVSGSSSRGRG